MKCPLIQKSIGVEVGEVFYEPLDCLKEECAWWDKDRSCCAEVSKIGAMVALNSIMTEIADKMPHEKQFRR